MEEAKNEARECTRQQVEIKFDWCKNTNGIEVEMHTAGDKNTRRDERPKSRREETEPEEEKHRSITFVRVRCN